MYGIVLLLVPSVGNKIINNSDVGSVCVFSGDDHKESEGQNLTSASRIANAICERVALVAGMAWMVRIPALILTKSGESGRQ